MNKNRTASNEKNGTAEVLMLWEAFKPQVETLIEEKTKNCIRAKKGTVATAPSGGTMGVKFPFDNNTYNLPYSSAVANVEVGSQVWVITPYDNSMTNAVVVNNGSWSL